MHSFQLLALTVLITCAPTAGRADPIIYNLSGTFADGTQLSGSFTYGGPLLGNIGYLLNGDAHVGVHTFVNGSEMDCENGVPSGSPLATMMDAASRFSRVYLSASCWRVVMV